MKQKCFKHYFKDDIKVKMKLLAKIKSFKLSRIFLPIALLLYSHNHKPF